MTDSEFINLSVNKYNDSMTEFKNAIIHFEKN